MSGERQIPNIEYLGRTYDVVAMDPFALGSTSKSQNVFDWSDTHRQSSIGNYLIPRSVNLSVPNSTQYVSETKTVSSCYELQTSAKTDVEIDAGLPGVFEFSASKSFKDMSSWTKSRKMTFGYARAYRERHIVSLDLMAPHPDYTLTRNFRQAVDVLPTEPSNASSDAYDRFVQEFGTHLTTRVTLGGLAVQRTQGEASRYLTSSDREDDFKAKTSAVIKSVSAGASASTATKSHRSTDVSDELQRFEVDFVGGKGSTDGITDEWLASLDEDPAIIKATLEPLSRVLDARFFPEDAAINDKATMLDLAIRRWIERYGTPGSLTAPLRFGERVVIVLPWNDEKTLQFARTMEAAIAFPLTVDHRPDPSAGKSAAIVLEPLDRARANTPVLSGDKVRIKHVGRNRYAGLGANGFVFDSDQKDAAVLIICHEHDDLKQRGGEYFTETDKIKFVFAAAPTGVIENFLGINPSGRALDAVKTEKMLLKVRLLRTEWLG